MRNQSPFLILLIGVVAASHVGSAGAGSTVADHAETMKDSIVYLATSAYGYSLSEPWKHESLSESWACATAVGEYQVITAARGVRNLAFVKALRHGQNEFIRAAAKIVDYESDLCLIELDPNELREPLKPLDFADDYAKGKEVLFHWLSSNGHLYDGRGYFDRANVNRVRTSYSRRLRYAVANTSRRMGRGEVYCLGSTPIGIGCGSTDDREAELIPGETIKRFLDAIAEDGTYKGFGEVGFVTSELLDPAMRSFLQMPASLAGGAYVADVYTLGTGADGLRQGDVILTIDGHAIDSYGRYSDPTRGPLSFHCLITRKVAGERVTFTLWRDGRETEISAEVRNFRSTDMLVPYHEYDLQPEYAVIGGFIFQKLTREYLTEFGDTPSGQAPSHLYHYYRDLAFKPGDQRRHIVLLSYVLPTATNLGYTGLGQLVVRRFNGRAVTSITDIVESKQVDSDSPHHVVKFELNSPTVVIPREELPAVDAFVRDNYGIRELSNIRR